MAERRTGVGQDGNRKRAGLLRRGHSLVLDFALPGLAGSLYIKRPGLNGTVNIRRKVEVHHG